MDVKYGCLCWLFSYPSEIEYFYYYTSASLRNGRNIINLQGITYLQWRRHVLLGGLIPGGLNCLLKDFTLPDQGTGPDDLQVLEVCSVLTK